MPDTSFHTDSKARRYKTKMSRCCVRYLVKGTTQVYISARLGKEN
jgi:hypothetical protein